MTPLNLRRRLRSALTVLRGVSPDEAAEVRAAYRVAYDCGDDEPIADLMRQAVGQIGHLRTRVDVLKAQLDAMDQAHADTLSAHYRVVGELDGIRAGLCTDGDTRDALRHVSAVLDDAGVSIPNCDRGQGCTSYHLTHRIHVLADERDALRTELATGAARQALDAIAAACGCAEWEYPGQVARDVEAVVKERDEAVVLISTVRAQNQGYAAELAEVDQILGRALGYPTMGPEVGGDHTTVCTGDHTPASLAAEAASVIHQELDCARKAVAGEAAMRGERDRLHAKQQEDARILLLLWEWTYDRGNQYVPTGGDADTFGDGVRRAQDRVQNILATRRQVAEPTPAPKRKRTKEERWEAERRTLAFMWDRTYGAAHDIRRALERLGRSATSREIIEDIEADDARSGFRADERTEMGMRLVSDLARAGYLTVAKGPGGVRVYGLKEGE